MFAIGRNHPAVREALNERARRATCPISCRWTSRCSPACSPNACSASCPSSTRCSSPIPAPRRSRPRSNSRARATGRPGIVYCSDAFHGLTYGALSMNGDNDFPQRLRAAVRRAASKFPSTISPRSSARWRRGRCAAFIVEPIQGKGVNMPDRRPISPTRRGFAANTARCSSPTKSRPASAAPAASSRSSIGDVEPDMVLLAKALSGGHVPVGAVLTRKSHLRQGVQPHGPRRRAWLDLRQERSRHGGRHRHARSARIGTAHRQCARAPARGCSRTSRRMAQRYELVKAVRGKGLMIGVEFGPPQSLEAQGGVERARGREQRPVLPADHHSAVQASTRSSLRSPATAAIRSSCCRPLIDRRRLRLDRARL